MNPRGSSLLQRVPVVGRCRTPAASTFRCASSLFSTTASTASADLTTSNTSPDLERTTLNQHKASSDGVVGRPIDFDVAAKIEGHESQIVTVTLEPGQVLRAESGAMMYMTDGVQMETTTGGGLSSGFQRMLTGQNFFIVDYTYHPPHHTTGTNPNATTGTVALGTDFPSKIVRLNVPEYGGKLICQKGALLCASHTIDIQMEYSKNLTTGFFGGEGFILQVCNVHALLLSYIAITRFNFFTVKRNDTAWMSFHFDFSNVYFILFISRKGLTGDGDVFLKAGGTLIRRELRDGEQLRISSGCLVAFSNGVDYGRYNTC